MARVDSKETGPPSTSVLLDLDTQPTELLAAVARAGLPQVGRSVLGTPLYAGETAPGASDGARVLVVGGVHGDEPASVVAVLAALAAKVPASTAVFAWPALNPDGLLRRQKDNARGVDLNRNFAARNFSVEHPPGYDPGPAPLSEPETAALAAAVDAFRPSAVVAVHAPFACVNYDGPARAWAERIAAACGWPARGDIGYPTPGSLGSWLGVDRALPVVTLELPGGAYSTFADRASAALRVAMEEAPVAQTV